MDDQYYRKKRRRFDPLAWLTKSLRKKRVRIALLIIIPVLSFITFSNKGILQRLSLESQKSEMEEKIRGAQAEQARLQQQSKALDNDPKAIEKVAREKYGMVRQGETVYKVKKER